MRMISPLNKMSIARFTIPFVKGGVVMNYIWIGFLIAIGWKCGAFIFDVGCNVIYRLLPEKFKKKKKAAEKSYVKYI
jgi:hypothetical protein